MTHSHLVVQERCCVAPLLDFSPSWAFETRAWPSRGPRLAVSKASSNGQRHAQSISRLGHHRELIRPDWSNHEGSFSRLLPVREPRVPEAGSNGHYAPMLHILHERRFTQSLHNRVVMHQHRWCMAINGRKRV